MNMKSLKEISRIAYEASDDRPPHETIQTGALQRIADAIEAMASNYIQLQKGKELYERWYKNESEENRRLARRISALQGVITRMKRKAK